MPTGPGTIIGISIFALLVLASAVIVVTIRNLFRAALSLGVVLIGVAGLFIMLEADFLAFVQILVYVGAILTLVVFAVMLTARLHGPSSPQFSRAAGMLLPATSPSAGGIQWPAAIASLALFVLLALMTRVMGDAGSVASQPVTINELGRELITTLILPFEVVSLVFVAALVGSIAVAYSRSDAPKRPLPRLPFPPARVR